MSIRQRVAELGPRRTMFLVSAGAVLSSFVASHEHRQFALTALWATTLITTGLLRPKPPARLHRFASGISAIVSAAAIFVFACLAGGINTDQAAVLKMLPLLFLVVVPDDYVVSATCSVASLLGVVALCIMSPEGTQLIRWIVESLLVGGLAIGGSYLYFRERRREVALLEDRGRVLQELAVSERLRSQSDRLQGVGRAAAEVRHEINNPLTYVMGNLELVYDQMKTDAAHGKAVDEELFESIREALPGTRQINDIVANLKMMAEPDRGVEALDMAELINKALAVANNEIRHRARLVRDFQPALQAWASRANVTQILINLLFNAAQAIPVGRVEKERITVTLRPKDPDMVAVEIRDTGAGISRQALKHVFEAHFSTKGEKGSGLGLAICRRLVVQNGGHIELTSELGEDTTVAFTLPRAAPEQISFPRAPRVNDTIAGTRLLVVDDEVAIGTAIAKMLKPLYEVVFANTGQAALDRLRNGGQIDLILCDLMMPQMTGVDLHRILTREAPGLAARTIFMSGGVFSTEVSTFWSDLPAPRKLSKPIQRQELLERLAAVAGSPGTETT